MLLNKKILTASVIFFVLLLPMGLDAQTKKIPGWQTNFDKRIISLDELMSGGPGKDGIPAIDNPKFIPGESADKWLKDNEPVVYLRIGETARAYPLQILMWHEMVNDEVEGIPVLVTFCPLCHSAIVFDRRIENKLYTFGVSGMLRHSDMIMYDRQTESFWQQLNGQALVGDLTGRVLTQLPSQIISYGEFKEIHPNGAILSKDTGFRRNYGENPYSGYDDINNTPFLLQGRPSKKLPPMQKLIAVTHKGIDKAYPYNITRNKKVLHDTIAGDEVVIFHTGEASSSMDNRFISRSRKDGSTGIFHNKINGKKHTFEFKDGKIIDKETGSIWGITGEAVEGQLKGMRLEPLVHGDFFAFSWLVFKPNSEIYNN